MDKSKKLLIMALGIAIIAIPILLAYYILHILTLFLLFVLIIPAVFLKKKEYLSYFFFGVLIGAIVSILFFLYVAIHLWL